MLSRDTGTFARNYNRDPYGDYYTNEFVSFGASFNDDRLHPKAYVLGIEIGDSFKAYHADSLPVGTTNDTINGVQIEIEKNTEGKIRIYAGPDKTLLQHIGGFWFSWAAVHPNTELFK